jgi:phage terminase large subunit
MEAVELFESAPSPVEYVVASPDLWNRRQDSGLSGVTVMQSVSGMPPMRAADDRRVAGWRTLRQYLHGEEDVVTLPRLHISVRCDELIHCMESLLCDENRAEDAADRPHHLTHAPEALRYGVMSDAAYYLQAQQEKKEDFRLPSGRKQSLW